MTLSRETIGLLIIFPWVGAFIWLLLSQGWARTVQGGEISQQTRKRQRIGFWVVVVTTYFVMFAGWYNHHRQ
jgi:hypothetical protein